MTQDSTDIDAAIDALRGRNLESVEAALQSLRSRGAAIVPRLLDALDHPGPSPSHRQARALVRLLGELGDEASIDAIAARLVSRAAHPRLAESVERALLELGPLVVDALRTTLAPPATDFSPLVGRVLARLAPPSADTLAEALAATPLDATGEARVWLCKAVGARHAHHPGLREALRHHATAVSDGHRRHALEALLELGQDDVFVVDTIAATLQRHVNPDDQVHLLARVRDPDAVSRACELLGHLAELPARSISTVMQLRMHLGDPEATAWLLERLDPDHRAFESALDDARSHPTCQALTERLRAALPHVTSAREVRVRIALVRHGDADAADTLAEQLTTLSSGLVGRAVHTLLEHAPRHTETAVAIVDGEHHPETARRVLRALAARDRVTDTTRAAVAAHWRAVHEDVRRRDGRLERRVLEDATLARVTHEPHIDRTLAESLATHLEHHERTLRQQQIRFVHGGLVSLEILARSTWLSRCAALLARRGHRFELEARHTLGARLAALVELTGWFVRQLPTHGGDPTLESLHRTLGRATLSFAHASLTVHLPETLRRALTDPTHPVPETLLDDAVRHLERRNVLERPTHDT